MYWMDEDYFRDEIVGGLEDQFPDAQEIVDGLVSANLLTIEAPIYEIEGDENVFTFTEIKSTADYKRAHGKTKKPGNVIVNFKEMLWDIPDIGMGIEGLKSSSKAYIVLLALSILFKVIKSIIVKLDYSQVICLIGIRDVYNEKTGVDIEKARSYTADLVKSHELNDFNMDEYDKILDDLTQIGTIELLEGRIYLKEKVEVKYGCARD